MFVRVRDKATRHQYDVWETSVRPEAHEVMPRFEPSRTARPAKPYVPKGRTKKPTASRRASGRPSAKNSEKE